jgi:hypothetical protein
MPKPSLKEPTDEEKQQIEEIRAKFQREVNTNPDLYHVKDIEKVLSNDWEVHRFLLAADGNLDNGLNRLISAMKWRKQFAVRDLTENDFPQEFYKMLLFGKARNGSTLVITRSKYYIPISEWRQLFKNFSVFILEWLDVNNSGNGITVLIDCRDTGLANADFDFICFLKPIQSKYFPCLIKMHLNCEIPWILNSIAHFILSLMSEKTRKLIFFIKKSQLFDYISEDEIPQFLGGSQTNIYSWLPSGSVSAEEIAQRVGISNKSLNKFVSHLRPLLE